MIPPKQANSGQTSIKNFFSTARNTHVPLAKKATVPPTIIDLCSDDEDAAFANDGPSSKVVFGENEDSISTRWQTRKRKVIIYEDEDEAASCKPLSRAGKRRSESDFGADASASLAPYVVSAASVSQLDTSSIASPTATRTIRVSDSNFANTLPVSDYNKPAVETVEARHALRDLDANATVTRLDRPPSALKTVPQYMFIFNNLHEICALDDDRGLDKFVSRFSKARLLHIIDDIFRQPIKDIMRDDDYANKQRLLDTGGDNKDQRSGWYIDVVTDSQSVAWFKLYPGQAHNLSRRISGHLKPSTIARGTSLHYRVIRAKTTRKSNYVVIAAWIDNEDIDGQLLNFMELYAAVLFQALPRKTLLKYLPAGNSLRQPERGLMVANPLSQSQQQRGMTDAERNNEKTKAIIRAISQLNDSTDPEIVEHYKYACDYLRSVQYIPAITAMRDKSKKKHLYRGPENEFEAYVYVICDKCKLESSIKLDPAPLYCITTGNYLVRQQRHCPIPGATRGDRNQKEKVVYYPIDGRPSRSYSWLSKHKDDPKSINQSVNNASWTAPIARAPDDHKMAKDSQALEVAMRKSRKN